MCCKQVLVKSSWCFSRQETIGRIGRCSWCQDHQGFSIRRKSYFFFHRSHDLKSLFQHIILIQTLKDLSYITKAHAILEEGATEKSIKDISLCEGAPMKYPRPWLRDDSFYIKLEKHFRIQIVQLSYSFILSPTCTWQLVTLIWFSCINIFLTLRNGMQSACIWLQIPIRVCSVFIFCRQRP